MFTRIWLFLRDFPHWLATAKKRNPWLFLTLLAGGFLLVGILLNFLTFRADAVYLVLTVGVPVLWVLFQPFMMVRFGVGPAAFGRRAAAVLPVLVMTFADLLATPLVLAGRDALGPGSFTELYLLAFATVLRLPFVWLAGRRDYRGKVAVDLAGMILSLAFSVVLHSLAITAA